MKSCRHLDCRAGHADDPVGMYVDSRFSVSTQVEDAQTYQMILAQQENDENAVDQEGNLIGENKTAEAAAPGAQAIDTSMEKLSDYEYLLGNFYTVDSSTMADSQLINAENLLGKDLKIDQNAEGPKVLIYHTHSQETYCRFRAGRCEHFHCRDRCLSGRAVK